MTWGGHATDAAPGAPMPEHGKSLGKIAAADFKALIQKGLVQYGKCYIIRSALSACNDYLPGISILTP